MVQGDYGRDSLPGLAHVEIDLRLGDFYCSSNGGGHSSEGRPSSTPTITHSVVRVLQPLKDALSRGAANGKELTVSILEAGIRADRDHVAHYATARVRCQAMNMQVAGMDRRTFFPVVCGHSAAAPF